MQFPMKFDDFDFFIQIRQKKKKSCVYCNMSGKNGPVSRDYYYYSQPKTTEMHILAVIMLHQHKFCAYKGKRKLKLLITCGNFVLFAL